MSNLELTEDERLELEQLLLDTLYRNVTPKRERDEKHILLFDILTKLEALDEVCEPADRLRTALERLIVGSLPYLNNDNPDIRAARAALSQPRVTEQRTKYVSHQVRKEKSVCCCCG